MGSIAVLIKHSGRWNYEQQYEEYISDAILLSVNATYEQLYTVLTSHIDVDLTCKFIEIEYQLTDNEVKIHIRNDMGLKVYILQKKELKDLSNLPLYVSVSDRDNFSTLVSSSLYNSESLRMIVNASNVEAYGERRNMSVVSDRNASIIKVVSEVYNDVPHYAFLDSKNFKKGPYCSDLYKPKTVLQTYDLPIYPLPHKDDWIIPKKILNEAVLPQKYKRPPGRPPKKERGKSGRDMFEKKNKNYCGSCGCKGHNRRSCRKYNK
ncbi:putative S-methyl-5'-thioadenosine phosphorylase-like [Capsicum annuum]|nr:putative S-methyl-5'-thioadenosine phosphorylase-like [Capsicum annuum]